MIGSLDHVRPVKFRGAGVPIPGARNTPRAPYQRIGSKLYCWSYRRCAACSLSRRGVPLRATRLRAGWIRGRLQSDESLLLLEHRYCADAMGFVITQSIQYLGMGEHCHNADRWSQ